MKIVWPMRLIFFSRKHGRIIVFGCPKIWPPSIGSLRLIGWRICGDPIRECLLAIRQFFLKWHFSIKNIDLLSENCWNVCQNQKRFFLLLFFCDSFFKNAKSVTFQTMTIPNHYIWMYRDKTILYMVKLTLRLSCAMNFAIYPHDTQECKLQMESCKCLPLYISHSLNHIRKLMRLQFLVYSCNLTPWWIHVDLLYRCAFSVSYHGWHDFSMGSKCSVGCRW